MNVRHDPWTSLLAASCVLTLAGCDALVARPAGQRVGELGARATGGWHPLPDAPTARTGAAAAPVGLTLHILGGSADGQRVLDRAEAFRAFDQWSTSPGRPTAAVEVFDVRDRSCGGSSRRCPRPGRAPWRPSWASASSSPVGWSSAGPAHAAGGGPSPSASADRPAA